MFDDDQNDRPQTPPVANFDPAKERDITESGELERPVLRRRKIDCGGNPEVTDRRDARRGGGHRQDLPKAG